MTGGAPEITRAEAKTHRVKLANRGGRSVMVREDQSILDACEEAGIVLPVACRYGGCITCAAKCLSGKVVQPGATALKKRQARAGYALLCVARPRSDCEFLVGVESHDELYRHPFADASMPVELEEPMQR